MLEPDRSERLTLLYEAYSARVLAYALRRTKREEAEEVVGETFLVAWRHLDDVPADPMPWLLGVARRLLANQRRGSARRAALSERLENVPRREPRATGDPADEVAARLSLGEALARLGEWDREALLLTVWDGLDNRDAAAVMGCSGAAFAVRLHRARRRITKHFDELRRTDGLSARSRVPVEEAR